MNFIRSNILRRHVSATEIIREDLPTNPLSHLLITVSGFNATDEATLAEILAFLNTVTVTDQGQTVVSLQSEDLYAEDCYLYGRRPHLSQRLAADNTTRTLTLCVPFGRKIYDPDECYPARSRGDLKLLLDTTVMATSIDNGEWSIEAIEMPDANPSRYLKSTTRTVKAPGATGDNDYRLPIGNDIVALLIRMTTFPGAGSHVYGVDDVTILKSNKEHGYVGNVAASLVGDRMFRLDGQSGIVAAQDIIPPDSVIWIDYDPLGDGKWLLETADASDLVLRMNMGVDEATNVTVMELVDV